MKTFEQPTTMLELCPEAADQADRFQIMSLRGLGFRAGGWCLSPWPSTSETWKLLFFVFSNKLKLPAIETARIHQTSSCKTFMFGFDKVKNGCKTFMFGSLPRSVGQGVFCK